MRRLHDLAFAALLGTASPALAETGGTFRDWTLTCTPGLLCNASTYREGQGRPSGFGFERAASADAVTRLTFTLAPEARLVGAIGLSVDGRPPLSLPASAFRVDEFGTARGEDARIDDDLLGTLRNGRSVTVTAQTDKGPLEIRFSLSGLVAALRKMDDDQQRVGTRTALIDRGDRPLPDRARLPADVATPDDLPAPVRALWQGAGDCGERGDDTPFGDLGFSAPFGEATRLFVLACGLPGAYNAPSRLYSYADGAASADVVPLATMTAAGPSAELTAWNVDLQGDRLFSWFKGRGIGDCGQTAVWRIDAGASALVLAEARDKPDCDGEGGDPDAWPLVWPKR